uniref:CASAMP N-terminal domain-containing protein n=1 Tax=Glossina brevipalpis TaxID=37001 RepID=A0A1A9VZT4_9MUSC
MNDRETKIHLAYAGTRETEHKQEENLRRITYVRRIDLGNATICCQTLPNLYLDPNYQCQNHRSILQTLARKGVPVNESKDINNYPSPPAPVPNKRFYDAFLILAQLLRNEWNVTDVRIDYLPTVEGSIRNVLVVSNLSERLLSYNVFNMLPEDIKHMILNLLVIPADLFNLFEIHPANCVHYPGMDSLAFIVHKSLGTTTLSSMYMEHQQQQQQEM